MVLFSNSHDPGELQSLIESCPEATADNVVVPIGHDWHAVADVWRVPVLYLPRPHTMQPVDVPYVPAGQSVHDDP